MIVPIGVIGAVDAALALLPTAMTSPEALVELYAIGLQESRFTARRQMGGGPAVSYWQMEQGGGVAGVYRHQASRYWASKLCEARGCPFEIPAIYARLATDDVLGAGWARLLLFTDPRRLPTVSDRVGAWACYQRNWRPGKPHPATWPDAHDGALAALVATKPTVTA